MCDFATHYKKIFFTLSKQEKEEKNMNAKLGNVLNMRTTIERQKQHGGGNPISREQCKVAVNL